MKQDNSFSLKQLTHKFVDEIPEELEDSILYVSMKFGTVVHKCVCGCGEEVVTPLGPSEWCITYDGKTISLDPSVGNWGFPCKSHYWIERNSVRWARSFTGFEVTKVRQKARMRRENYYSEESGTSVDVETEENRWGEAIVEKRYSTNKSIFAKLRDLFL